MIFLLKTRRARGDRYEELFDHIVALYSGDCLAEVRKEWDLCVRMNDEAGRKRFRGRFLRRMYDVSAFMKTLKQNSTMSYNCRSDHVGTMWESRFRVREHIAAVDAENLYSPQRKYRLAAKGRKLIQ